MFVFAYCSLYSICQVLYLHLNLFTIKISFIFLACPDGTFGTDCSMQCGKCLGVGQCNHIDGTCKNGCEIGYSGSKCTEGKHIVITFYIATVDANATYYQIHKV